MLSTSDPDDAASSGLCAFSPAGDDGPPVPISKEAAELCGMLESAMECTGAAISNVFRRGLLNMHIYVYLYICIYVSHDWVTVSDWALQLTPYSIGEARRASPTLSCMHIHVCKYPPCRG